MTTPDPVAAIRERRAIQIAEFNARPHPVGLGYFVDWSLADIHVVLAATDEALADVKRLTAERDAAALAERAQIVAWLRRSAVGHTEAMSNILRFHASAIERGDHVVPRGK